MKSVLSRAPRLDHAFPDSALFEWETEPEHGRLAFGYVPGTDGILALRISGDIDVTTVGSFGIHLDETLNDRQPFVLDLTDVQFFCASALSVLEIMAARARRLGLPWAVTGNNAVRRPLTAMKLNNVVPYFPTLDDAFHHVAGGLRSDGVSA